MNQAFERAVCNVGGPAKMLARLQERRPADNLKPAHLYHWRKRMEFLPAEYCPDVEAITAEVGKRVACEELNPSVNWAVLRLCPAQISGVAAEPVASDEQACELSPFMHGDRRGPHRGGPPRDHEPAPRLEPDEPSGIGAIGGV